MRGEGRTAAVCAGAGLGLSLSLMLATALGAADVGPRAAWAAGPMEVRVAFDRPVGPAMARAVVGRSIAFDSARPAKTLPPRPAPAPPSAQRDDSRGSVRVAAARLDDGGTTLVLTTDPHPRAATYTLALPGGGPEVRYDLTGVEAAWDDGTEGAEPAWAGWWPSADPASALAGLKGTAAGEQVAALLKRKGRFVLNTMVTLPRGPVTVTVRSSAPVSASLGGEDPAPAPGPGGAQGAIAEHVAGFKVESTGDPTFLTLTLPTGGPGGRPPTVRVMVLVERGAAGPRDLPPGWTRLPWVPASPPPPGPLQNLPELAGGDPAKGRDVFRSAEARCAACHKAGGEGGTVGPDLAGQVGRDRREVYRDIAEPSARIHPDYVPYTLALKDGRVLAGTVRAEGADAVRVTDTEAKSVVVPRAEVDELRPSATSVMPVGLAGVIGPEKLRDLIAYLTAPQVR